MLKSVEIIKFRSLSIGFYKSLFEPQQKKYELHEFIHSIFGQCSNKYKRITEADHKSKQKLINRKEDYSLQKPQFKVSVTL